MSLLQNNLIPPLRHIHRIHIPARLHTESAPRASRRDLDTPILSFDLRDIDELPRVELERGLRAQDVEVDLGVWVVCGDELRERRGARVEGHGGLGGVGDEAVVDLGLSGAEREGLIRGYACEGGSLRGGGDSTVVEEEVGVGGEGDFGAGDGREAREVEVSD